MYVEKRLTCEEMLKLYYNEHLKGKKTHTIVLFKSDNGLTFKEEGTIKVLKMIDDVFIVETEYFFRCLMDRRYTFLDVKEIFGDKHINENEKFVFADKYSL